MFVAQGCTVNRCVCMYVVSYIEESQFQRDTRCVEMGQTRNFRTSSSIVYLWRRVSCVGTRPLVVPVSSAAGCSVVKVQSFSRHLELGILTLCSSSI